MSAHLGFNYYYDLLGLDPESYAAHYRFENSGSSTVSNDAPNFGYMVGTLSSVGNFYSNSGSGHFTGQKMQFMDTGVLSEPWTHIFIIEKTGRGAGVIFDSTTSGLPYSGYAIGINDNNRLYLQAYEPDGPFSRTSDIILGKKNLIAVTKSNNLLNFYSFDFNNDDLLSDRHSINGSYVLPARKGSIGGPADNSLYFTQKSPFTGFVDEYVYLKEALTPASIRYLVSGLMSDLVVTPAPVTTFNAVEVTGYSSGVTGVTGVVGYQNVITGSGVDQFDGSTKFFYQTVPISGYLSSGFYQIALTGNVAYSTTGDATSGIALKSGLLKDFYLDEISYIKKIDSDDISLANVFVEGEKVNLRGGYDFVGGQFQLQDEYADDDIQVYLNGVSQISQGYVVTGDFYGSGISLSGDYKIEGFYLDSTGFFGAEDVLVYDNLSGTKQKTFVANAASGHNEQITVVGKELIFFNGVLMLPIIDYINSGTGYVWQTTKYNGESGSLVSFPLHPLISNYTGMGPFVINTGRIPRRNSQVFLNGVRQLIDQDYVENSSLDLIEQSGIFDRTLSDIYNNDAAFFNVDVILSDIHFAGTEGWYAGAMDVYAGR